MFSAFSMAPVLFEAAAGVLALVPGFPGECSDVHFYERKCKKQKNNDWQHTLKTMQLIKQNQT